MMPIEEKEITQELPKLQADEKIELELQEKQVVEEKPRKTTLSPKDRFFLKRRRGRNTLT